MSDRGTLRVSRRSWHGKLYHFWREHSEFKNTEKYRENLCHYVRVVLFWGPVSMFFRWGYPTSDPFLTPFTVLGSIAALVGLVVLAILHPLNTLLGFLLLVGFIVLVVAGGLLASYIDEHKYQIRDWWRDDGFGTHTVKRIGRALNTVGTGIAAVFKGVYRLLSHQILKLELGLWIVISAMIVGSILSPVILGLSVAAVIFTGVLCGVSYFYDDIKAWIESHRKDEVITVQKDENIIKVGARFVVAKKHKICPFIEVE